MSSDPKLGLSKACLRSICNLMGWREMGVISWKIKMKKCERVITLLQLSRLSFAIQSLCCSKRNLKSANLIAHTHMHAHVRVHTHTHTHTSSLRKMQALELSKWFPLQLGPYLSLSWILSAPTQPLLPTNKPQKQGHCIYLFLNL